MLLENIQVGYILASDHRMFKILVASLNKMPVIRKFIAKQLRYASSLYADAGPPGPSHRSGRSAFSMHDGLTDELISPYAHQMASISFQVSTAGHLPGAAVGFRTGQHAVRRCR